MISAPTLAPAADTPTAPTKSLLWLANATLRHRRLVAWLAVAVAIVSVPLALLRDRTYTATASIMSAQRGVNRGVVSVAEQLGIGAGGFDASGPTAQFYADLLQSREILTSVVRAPYTVHTADGPVTRKLVDFLDITTTDSALKEADAIAELSKRISPTVSTRTGVIRFKLTLPYPELARDAAARFVDELNRFNLERRQTQATSERKFTEARLRDVRQELADAEERLAAFSRGNVSFDSPLLRLQRDRLEREVMVRQSVYSTLATSYEQARIEEVRDIPVITTIEHPILPVRPDSRQIVRLGIMSLLVGALLGVLLALAIESFGGNPVGDGDPLSEFRGLLGQTLSGFRRPFDAIRRRSASA